MAQEQLPLFNFYFRYKWNEEDFAEWQEGMVSLQRAAMEGLFGGAVMGGFEVEPVSGMTVEVADGIAIGATGYLMVENDTNVIEFEAPVSNVRKDLIVARPKLVDSDLITRPTTPFDSVPLKTLQDCEVVVIEGTPSATPEYPSKQNGDIILAGVRTYAGQTSVVANDFDFDVREIYGKNSDFQQNSARYDDRVRPFRVDHKTLGVKPSQLLNPRTRGFSFVVNTRPSIFPKNSGGEYVHGDTFLDFETGQITGADEASPDFTPTIPSAGAWIVATVSLTTNDLLSVLYGTEGTRDECLDGIKNQVTVGAGAVTPPGNTKLLAYVLLKSGNGSNITELEYVDARVTVAGTEGGGGLGGEGVVTANLPYSVTSADRFKVLQVDTTASSGEIQLPAPVVDFMFQIKDVGGNLNTNKCRLLPASGEMIEGVASPYDLEANNGKWGLYTDGTDWWFF